MIIIYFDGRCNLTELGSLIMDYKDTLNLIATQLPLEDKVSLREVNKLAADTVTITEEQQKLFKVRSLLKKLDELDQWVSHESTYESKLEILANLYMTDDLTLPQCLIFLQEYNIEYRIGIVYKKAVTKLLKDAGRGVSPQNVEDLRWIINDLATNHPLENDGTIETLLERYTIDAGNYDEILLKKIGKAVLADNIELDRCNKIEYWAEIVAEWF